LRSFAWKRALDLIVAIPVALVAVPVMLVLALAVKLDSPGPVLFRQTRLGRDRRLFPILKVRTMVHPDAGVIDQVRERVLSEGRDPRITRVGRFLRASSLDELPQVWNVLRGEMSLVGPRPALPTEVESFDEELRERHNVRPGITGLWQVEARDNPSFASYRRLDLFYVKNWSISLDLVILILTAQSVIVRALKGLVGRGDEDAS
jgi:lipopolysaccharide/colanic/teichoic acid biosynthesis glycosyltransferase